MQLLLPGNALFPDYILLDIITTGMGGKECLGEMKRDSRIKHLHVVVYSTTKLKEDIDECLRLGTDYFLTKLTTFWALRQKLFTRRLNLQAM